MRACVQKCHEVEEGSGNKSSVRGCDDTQTLKSSESSCGGAAGCGQERTERMVSQSHQNCIHKYKSALHGRTLNKTQHVLALYFWLRFWQRFPWLGISSGTDTQRSELIMWRGRAGLSSTKAVEERAG